MPTVSAKRFVVALIAASQPHALVAGEEAAVLPPTDVDKVAFSMRGSQKAAVSGVEPEDLSSTKKKQQSALNRLSSIMQGLQGANPEEDKEISQELKEIHGAKPKHALGVATDATNVAAAAALGEESVAANATAEASYFRQGQVQAKVAAQQARYAFEQRITGLQSNLHHLAKDKKKEDKELRKSIGVPKELSKKIHHYQSEIKSLKKAKAKDEKELRASLRVPDHLVNRIHGLQADLKKTEHAKAKDEKELRHSIGVPLELVNKIHGYQQTIKNESKALSNATKVAAAKDAEVQFLKHQLANLELAKEAEDQEMMSAIQVPPHLVKRVHELQQSLEKTHKALKHALKADKKETKSNGKLTQEVKHLKLMLAQSQAALQAEQAAEDDIANIKVQVQKQIVQKIQKLRTALATLKEEKAHDDDELLHAIRAPHHLVKRIHELQHDLKKLEHAKKKEDKELRKSIAVPKELVDKIHDYQKEIKKEHKERKKYEHAYHKSQRAIADLEKVVKKAGEYVNKGDEPNAAKVLKVNYSRQEQVAHNSFKKQKNTGVAKQAAEALAAAAAERAARAEAKLRKADAEISKEREINPGEVPLIKEEKTLEKENDQNNWMEALLLGLLALMALATLLLCCMVRRLKSQHSYHLMSILKLNADRMSCMDKIKDLTTPILVAPQEPEPVPVPREIPAPISRDISPVKPPPAPKPVPQDDGLLVDWHAEVQRVYVQPLVKEPPKVMAAPVVEQATKYVYLKARPVPIYEEVHIQTMPVSVLRMHAEHLHRTIGGQLQSVPTNDVELVEWVQTVQNAHVNPLQPQATSFAVPHVYIRGVPVPLYETIHLQQMPISQLRVHANHLYSTLGGVARPVPDQDALLLAWITEVHGKHLNHHLDARGLAGSSPITNSYTIPHPVNHVMVQGSPIPMFESQHLRTLPSPVLRAHADHLHSVMGSQIQRPPPRNDQHLHDWIDNVHKTHIAPLRSQAVPHAVPTVYQNGAPLPLYERQHLESMQPHQVRAYSDHLYKTIVPSNSVQFGSQARILR